MRLRLLTKLVWHDLYFDRKISLFIIASISAVLAPLLLLFSLKFGIVSQLQAKLINNPNNLEVKITESAYDTFGLDWFDKMKKDPTVNYIIPLTRALNLQVDLRTTQNKSQPNVELLPTSAGDPLIPDDMPLYHPNGIILANKTADVLQVKVGEVISLRAERILNQKKEPILVDLVIDGIVPTHLFNRHGGFVQLPLLEELEDFYDGFKLDKLIKIDTGKEKTTTHQHYAKARLFAKTLDDVAPLSQQLTVQGIENKTHAAEIEDVKAIEHVLNILFLIIAITSVIGCATSLVGSFLANIERKRKEISLLSLFGLNPREITVYLILQVTSLTTMAFVASAILYLLASFAVNQLLGSNLNNDNFISHLLPSHFVITFIITFVLAILIAIIGSRRANQIQPAESLREI
ncbi:ABC transporter permease [Lonepinella sp. BR2474]|uniref:ABC transporter permease n=1 Tax=Lonepinella sp. BR2474 TaxID=3434548 RepID=UPI003F6E2CA0